MYFKKRNLNKIKKYIYKKLNLVDRKYRFPRIWSNNELKKFAYLFTGSVLNISAWEDKDKEGKRYKDYFMNAKAYFISNYKKEACGLQGHKNEFFLDLTQVLDDSLKEKYEVVFNHTTLEHIYDVKTAFKNICLLSKDIVIIVVPFLQQMHADYGDYWRFTPFTIKKLFEENKCELLYLNFNNEKNASVYIFAIASKKPKKWKNKIHNMFKYKCEGDFLDVYENYIGCRAISNSNLLNLKNQVNNGY